MNSAVDPSDNFRQVRVIIDKYVKTNFARIIKNFNIVPKKPRKVDKQAEQEDDDDVYPGPVDGTLYWSL